MTAIQHWAPDAPTVGRCPCGGALMLVEDPGDAHPIEAQCRACGVPTGVARASAAVSDVTQQLAPASEQDAMPF